MKKPKKVAAVAPAEKPLNDREKMFVENYMRCLNKRQAYSETSGVENPETAAGGGWMIYNRPHVKAEIERRFQEIRQETNGIWARMSDFARSSMEHFISFVEVKDPKDGSTKSYPIVDLEKGVRAGMMHLVKRVVPTKYGIGIEIVDPLRATETLAKMEGILEPERDGRGDIRVNALDEYMREALERLRQKAAAGRK